MNKTRLLFIVQAMLLSAAAYLILALVVAVIIVNFFGSDHPHNMDEVLYFVLPMFAVPIGLLVGLIFGIIIKNNDFKRLKKLIVYSLGVLVIVCALLLLVLLNY